ncbi:SPOR domain-containing protein [Marinifilum sp. RC60d5]|uniref:SPOR domain-containing protein n=1 Tax=Marinifilum sp. RC60d5 TaxID=3458414 RepID=UPI00403601AA
MNNISKILLLCALIISVGLSSCKDSSKTNAKNPENKEIKKPSIKTKSAVKKKAEAKPVARKKTKPVVKKLPNKYFLIVASFENRSNAVRLQQKLTSEGFKSEMHKAPNGFTRVSYKGFSDRKLAFSELKDVRATEKHKDTWLYIKR